MGFFIKKGIYSPRRLTFFGKLRLRFVIWRCKQKRKRQLKKAIKNGYQPLQEF